MTVHLRSNLDRLYYAGSSQWVRDASRALDLGDVNRASQVAHDHDLPEAEVVLSFKGVPAKVALPVWPDLRLRARTGLGF
jgi:hypothetical protein